MRTSLRLLVLIVVTLACAVFASGCDDVIADPNFHTWCGDQLCSWKLESGHIQRAPTWNPKDYGVELLDSTDASHVTAISQTVSKTPTCLEFTTVADVVPEAQVTIGVDFDGDGTVEYEAPIASIGFSEQKAQVTAPLVYTGIEFIITKKGTGHAVLAQMDVRSRTDCTAAPVALHAQAMGTSCSPTNGGHECTSGVCCEGVCAECCVSTIPPRAEDGGLAPDPENTCSGGATCDKLPLLSSGALPSDAIGVGPNVIPRQCDPGVRKRGARSECLLAEDCTSNVCDGASWDVRSLTDGGTCPAPPAQDPNCYVYAVHAGVCR